MLPGLYIEPTGEPNADPRPSLLLPGSVAVMGLTLPGVETPAVTSKVAFPMPNNGSSLPVRVLVRASTEPEPEPEPSVCERAECEVQDGATLYPPNHAAASGPGELFLREAI